MSAGFSVAFCNYSAVVQVMFSGTSKPFSQWGVKHQVGRREESEVGEFSPLSCPLHARLRCFLYMTASFWVPASSPSPCPTGPGGFSVTPASPRLLHYASDSQSVVLDQQSSIAWRLRNAGSQAHPDLQNLSQGMRPIGLCFNKPPGNSDVRSCLRTTTLCPPLVLPQLC